MRRIEIEHDVFVSPQPSEAELQALPDQGIRSVIDLRTERGSEQAFPSEDERRLVEHLGVRYIHLPISRDQMGIETIDTFRKHLASAPKPVLVHAHGTPRAAAMVLADRAVNESWDMERTVEHARALDLTFHDHRIARAMEDYIEERSGQERHARGDSEGLDQEPIDPWARERVQASE